MSKPREKPSPEPWRFRRISFGPGLPEVDIETFDLPLPAALQDSGQPNEKAEDHHEEA